MATYNCANTCLNWASSSFYNGKCIDQSSRFFSPLFYTNQIQAMRISILATLFFCYLYCVYFFYVRLKTKSGAGFVVRDLLEFLCVVIGCSSMCALCIFQIIATSGRVPFLGYFSMVELLFSIADCAFVMSNDFSSSRLMSFSFKLSAGYSKTQQENLNRLFQFVAFACNVMAVTSVVGYAINLNSAVNGIADDSCDRIHEHLRQTCPWGFMPPLYSWVPWIRIAAVSISCFAKLLVLGVALRNFDSQHKQRTIESEVLQTNTLKIGHLRRRLILNAALLAAIFWFLVAFIILLPQRMASIKILRPGCEISRTECCLDFDQGRGGIVTDDDSSRTNPELNFFFACTQNWVSLAITVSLSPTAAIIRAVAYPICSMLAVRSFEFGATKSKNTSTHDNMSTFTRNQTGTAVFCLRDVASPNADRTEPQCALDDWGSGHPLST